MSPHLPAVWPVTLENHDMPGVIGCVGPMLGRHNVNIGEWRYGRDRAGGRAVSFINLDSAAPPEAPEVLRQTPEIYDAKLVRL